MDAWPRRRPQPGPAGTAASRRRSSPVEWAPHARGGLYEQRSQRACACAALALALPCYSSADRPATHALVASAFAPSRASRVVCLRLRGGAHSICLALHLKSGAAPCSGATGGAAAPRRPQTAGTEGRRPPCRADSWWRPGALADARVSQPGPEEESRGPRRHGAAGGPARRARPAPARRSIGPPRRRLQAGRWSRRARAPRARGRGAGGSGGRGTGHAGRGTSTRAHGRAKGEWGRRGPATARAAGPAHPPAWPRWGVGRRFGV